MLYRIFVAIFVPMAGVGATVWDEAQPARTYSGNICNRYCRRRPLSCIIICDPGSEEPSKHKEAQIQYPLLRAREKESLNYDRRYTNEWRFPWHGEKHSGSFLSLTPTSTTLSAAVLWYCFVQGITANAGNIGHPRSYGVRHAG